MRRSPPRYCAQSGLRFSRKALRPSWPSAEARRSAIVSIVSSRTPSTGRADTLRIRFFAAAMRAWRRLQQLPHALVHGRVQLVERHHAVDEAELLRPAPP